MPRSGRRPPRPHRRRPRERAGARETPVRPALPSAAGPPPIPATLLGKPGPEVVKALTALGRDVNRRCARTRTRARWTRC